MSVHFFSKGSFDQISGGYLYNKYVIDGLIQKGIELATYEVDDELPGDFIINNFSKTDVLIVDSLLIIENVEILIELAKDFKVYGLIHLPQVYDGSYKNDEKKQKVMELERKVYNAISLIVTSPFAKKQLIDMYQLDGDKITNIEPGVDNFESKKSYVEFPEKLICIANFEKRKAQHKIIEALSTLTSYDWMLDFYGNPKNDWSYFLSIKKLIEKHALESRVAFYDVVKHEEMNQLLMSKDLLLQMSSFETYSMIISEAIASGLPFVSSKVGAHESFAEANAGIFLETFEVEELASTLENLFTKKESYETIHENSTAVESRSWTIVAQEFIQLLNLKKVA